MACFVEGWFCPERRGIGSTRKYALFELRDHLQDVIFYSLLDPASRDSFVPLLRHSPPHTRSKEELTKEYPVLVSALLGGLRVGVCRITKSLSLSLFLSFSFYLLKPIKATVDAGSHASPYLPPVVKKSQCRPEQQSWSDGAVCGLDILSAPRV